MEADALPDNEPWATAFELFDEIEANLIAIALTDAGIDTRVHLNLMHVLYPIISWEAGTVQVLVPAGQVAAAKDVIRKVHNSTQYRMRSNGWTVIDGGLEQ